MRHDDEERERLSPAPEERPDGAEARPPLRVRLRHLLIGPPRSLRDRSLFAHLSLVPLLAWVGLGADGLSSSAYGPQLAFQALGRHTYLAVGLALLTAFTVFVISTAYSRIIEKFPHGGGGYVVATKILGPHFGLVSGCALLVDYVLTVTVSVATAGIALQNALVPYVHFPESWILPVDVLLIVLLTLLNLRGVRESIVVLAPIFLLFILTHLVLIGVGVFGKLDGIGATVGRLAEECRLDAVDPAVGWLGMGALLLRAFALGGGTYTGIEAVSSSMAILREPRAKTAKATMGYMAASLAFMAAGLIVCYLLWSVEPPAAGGTETMNSRLARHVADVLPAGGVFCFLTIITEAALLLVAAQAGFLAGPRTLANLAIDSWVPRRFAALSERLTTQNGVTLMSAASLGLLLFVASDATNMHDVLERLVVMYSINVFITFSLSMVAMVLYWWNVPRERPQRRRRITLFATGAVLCIFVLVVTVKEGFSNGAWVTLFVTGGLVGACILVRRHYVTVAAKLSSLYADLADLPLPERRETREPDPALPTAVVLVSSYGGLGIHTVYNVFRAFPDHFKGLVFMSIGVIDSGAFKGENAVQGLERRTGQMLKQYVELGQRLGVPSAQRVAIGTDAVATAEELCHAVAKQYPRSTFFAGKVIFKEEGALQRFLHNETAVALQKRLHFGGLTLVILPARVL